MEQVKLRITPRTTMSIRVSERERREIEEKAIATAAPIAVYKKQVTDVPGSYPLENAAYQSIKQQQTNENNYMERRDEYGDYEDMEYSQKQGREPFKFLAPLLIIYRQSDENGWRCYHVVLLCPVGEGDPQTMYQLTQEYIEKYLGDRYEALFAVHVDKRHLHSHIVFNSVSMIDGYKYQYTKQILDCVALIFIKIVNDVLTPPICLV